MTEAGNKKGRSGGDYRQNSGVIFAQDEKMEIIRRGFILKPRYLEIRMNAPIQGAGIASISAGDRSIVSAANAKNGKSQESSFFPATFRHFMFVKLYVVPSERNCCGSQTKCRCQCQYDPKP